MTSGSPEPGVRLSEIFVYPLKSGRGVSVHAVEVDRTGLRHDRRWMLVDAEGTFMSLRTHPRMAFLSATVAGDALRLEAPEMEPLDVPDVRGADAITVQVWREPRRGLDCGAEAAEWTSTFLGERCRLVRALAPEDGRRVTEDGWVLAGFADAQPALVVSTASLEGLNARLADPLPMSRFRPNLVVSGVPEAHVEDGWGDVTVGDVPVRCLRPCSRCAATTVDGDTAETGKEPLRTLATYRRGPDGQVYFGVNAALLGEGILRVEDPVRSAGR